MNKKAIWIGNVRCTAERNKYGMWELYLGDEEIKILEQSFNKEKRDDRNGI